jgi:hypothetical protein
LLSQSHFRKVIPNHERKIATGAYGVGQCYPTKLEANNVFFEKEVECQSSTATQNEFEDLNIDPDNCEDAANCASVAWDCSITKVPESQELGMSLGICQANDDRNSNLSNSVSGDANSDLMWEVRSRGWCQLPLKWFAYDFSPRNDDNILIFSFFFFCILFGFVSRTSRATI